MNEIIFFRVNRFQVYALVCTLVLMSLLIYQLFFVSEKLLLSDSELVVRKVEVALPPPDLSTSEINQSLVYGPDIQLNNQEKTPILALVNIKQKATLKTSHFQPENLRPDIKPADFNLSIDWQASGLSELDSTPVLLTRAKVVFPRNLAIRGITNAKVLLDVFIDENGRISLIAIKQTPYPELVRSVEKLVRLSRFSVPEKNGVPVKARFIWPVEFNKS